jgi:hypothetical protein
MLKKAINSKNKNIKTLQEILLLQGLSFIPNGVVEL